LIPVNQLSPVSALFIASVALLVIGLIATPPMKEAQATMTTANPVLELSESNFDEIVSGGKPVLVEFSAPWCAICQSMRPIFDDMAVNHGQVLFARINVDNNQALAMSYDIQQIPTYMMFVDGMSVDRKIGPIDEYGLEQWVLYHLGR
jgi:thioredoxin 1